MTDPNGQHFLSFEPVQIERSGDSDAISRHHRTTTAQDLRINGR